MQIALSGVLSRNYAVQPFSKSSGAPCWHRRLRIRRCHCCGSGSIPGLGTSACHGPGQKGINKKIFFNLKKVRCSTFSSIRCKLYKLSTPRGAGKDLVCPHVAHTEQQGLGTSGCAVSRADRASAESFQFPITSTLCLI